MRKNRYQEIVAKATEFIRTNLERPLSIPEIAEHVGFSGIHVRNAFRKTLNQGILRFIQNERVAKGKMLLQKTQLDITQIALEAGFESYAGFHRVFRRSIGMTPSLFREKVRQLNEIPVVDEDFEAAERKEIWFKDFFRSKEIESHWKPFSGDWRQHDGQLRSNGADCIISLQPPLPENSRLSFSVMAETGANLNAPGVIVRLLDEHRNRWHCEFAIATGKRSVGQLMHYRIGRQWNRNARLTAGEWHKIVLEIREEFLSLSINGKQVFSLRDAFPSVYSSRCYLDVGGYHCNVGLREFSIQNLGFMPVIPPVRQGDLLFNSGLYENARDLYLRFLQAGAKSDSEVMELRYKIGMCHLRTGSLSQAQGWAGKVVSLQEDRFWAEQAQLSLLELFWKTPDLPRMQEHMGLCFADAKARDQARIITQFALQDFISRGFFTDADQLLLTWKSLESPGTYPYQTVLEQMAENGQRQRHFAEAEEFLNDLIRGSDQEEVVMAAKINMIHLYHERGDIKKSEKLRMEIEQGMDDPFYLVRCRLTQATNFRAEAKFEDAIQVLKGILDENTAEKAFLGHATVHVALNLCCLGRVEEGRKALEEAHKKDPEFYPGSRHYLPFFLTEGNYSAAAQSFLTDYRNSKELVSSSAEIGTKAGILHELAGKIEDAKSIFKEVSQRFPEAHVRFFGVLAKVLLEDDPPLTLSQSKCEPTKTRAASSFVVTCPEPVERVRMSDAEIPGPFQLIEEMPYEHFRRSEMFYLIGLLMKKRGDKEAGRALFELSVKDDPALRWPAWFSKQRLG